MTAGISNGYCAGRDAAHSSSSVLVPIRTRFECFYDDQGCDRTDHAMKRIERKPAERPGEFSFAEAESSTKDNDMNKEKIEPKNRQLIRQWQKKTSEGNELGIAFLVAPIFVYA